MRARSMFAVGGVADTQGNTAATTDRKHDATVADGDSPHGETALRDIGNRASGSSIGRDNARATGASRGVLDLRSRAGDARHGVRSKMKGMLGAGFGAGREVQICGVPQIVLDNCRSRVAHGGTRTQTERIWFEPTAGGPIEPNTTRSDPPRSGALG